MHIVNKIIYNVNIVKFKIWYKVMPKHKTNQAMLELVDTQNEYQQLDFVLKIKDGQPNDLLIGGVIHLLSSLNNIIDIEEARFKGIFQGSIMCVVTVPQPLQAKAIQNIQKSTKKNKRSTRSIQNLMNKYGYEHDVEISCGYFSENGEYQAQQSLLTIEPLYRYQQSMTQEESFDGYVVRLQQGKDSTDHLTIQLKNGNEIKASCHREMLLSLKPYLATDTKLRFHGMATYTTSSHTYDMKLKNYVLERFNVIEEQSIDEWIEDFRSHGYSNWSSYEDPIAHWLKERS